MGFGGVGDLFVVLVLLAMVALPVVASLWRRFTGESIPSATVLVQHLTLWSGFLGALLATRAGKHLHLTTLDLFPEGTGREVVQVFTGWVSAAVTAVLAYAAAKLVHVESESRLVIGGIPFWWSMSVMPVTLAAMSVVFAWRANPGRFRWLIRLGGLSVVLLTFVWSEASLPDPGSWPLDSLGAPGRAFAATAAGFRSLLGPLATPGAIVWTFGIAVGIAFLLGAPVFVGMAGIAMVLFVKDSTPVAAVPTQTFTLVSSPTLAAIPLLTVAGYVLAEGGAAQRLVRAYRGLFGWMPGGLAVMTVAVAALFTTFTGASGVTILALGGLLLPSLLEDGYPEGFSVGLVTASGSLGLLFPPSLPVILYGVVAGTAIEDLFIGGLVPGILMIVLVAAYGVWMGVRCKAPRQKFRPAEALRSMWVAKWDLVFRELKPFTQLPKVLLDAGTLVGSVLILLGVALGLTSWFVDAEIPTQLVAWMTSHVKSPALFLLMLNVVLLVLGSVLEIYSAIVVVAPLVAPLGVAYGIDPVHLGVVFLANLELGFLFPPMGLNLFLSAQRFGKPLPFVYKKAFPFLVIMSAGVLLVTYLEPMTTGVVRLFKG
jgi:C4-dicarboxylate transporter DctM subunit